MPREWDAKTYDSLPLPHQIWGRRTLGRMKLRGDETVLDAGAGTGRDTAALLDLLPEGRVIAVDGSQRMLDRLASNLADRLDRVEVINADLTKPLPVTESVDAVFSVATFHWIHDHETLFRNIAGVLRPGGQFVAECGGLGCVVRVLAAVEDVLGTPAKAAHFAGAEETAERLDRAGFTDVEVDLLPDPARLRPGDEFRSYLRTVVLGPYLDQLPEPERDGFIRDVAARLPE
ncbi:MAG TPA: methyltransferase domain-containing protein, partial [Streptosporangiaceae bacterium]